MNFEKFAKPDTVREGKIWNAIGRGSNRLLVLALVFAMLFMPMGNVLGAETGVEMLDDGGSAVITEAGVAKEKVFYFRSNGTDPAPVIGGAPRYNLHNTSMVSAGPGNRTAYGGAWATSEFLISFYLNPPLAWNYTINGTMTSFIWLRADTGNNMDTWVMFTIYDVDPSGNRNSVLTSSTLYIDPMTSTYSEYKLTSNLAAPYTFPAGHSVEIEIYANKDSFNNRYFAWGNSTYPSRVVLNSLNYMNIDNVATVDSDWKVTNNFDPDAGDKNITFNATVSDPIGGYDVYWVNFTVETPFGETIYEWHPMVKTIGDDTTYLNNYSFDWNYTIYHTTVGRYNLTVYAVDNTGYNARYPDNPGDGTFGGHLEIFRTWFYIGGDLHYANIRVEDSLNITMNNTLFLVTSALGDIYMTEYTNNTGMANLSLVSGNYNFVVIWQDTRVSNQSVFVNENFTESNPIIINAGVFYKSLMFVDSQDWALPNAAVYVTHPNGTSTIDPYKTDSAGMLYFHRTAGGNYSISVIWLGVEVFFGTVWFANNYVENITCDVYHLTIRAIDSDGYGLENTQVVIYENETGIVRDSRLTDAGGYLLSRLPVGTYDIEVYWQESLVGMNLSVALNADASVIVECGVFRVTVIALDDMTLPVEDAKVSIISGDSGKVIATNITNATGGADVRLPIGIHTVEIFWQDVLVYSEIEDFDGDDVILVVSVHHLTIKVRDARNLPVEDAQVSLRYSGRTLASNVTNASGMIIERLPGCLLDISVTWQGALVNLTQHDLVATVDLTINATIYYLRFKIQDSTPASNPVENAQVVLTYVANNRTLDSNTTDAAGEIMTKLPAGDMEAAVRWQDVEVARVLETIDASISEQTITITVGIFELVVEVVDSRGHAVSGAGVTFVYQSSGKLLASEFTDASGSCSARLPHGTIELTVTWREVVVGTATHLLDSNDNTNVVIQADIYYLQITVLDSRNVPVRDADVRVIATTGGRLAGNNLTNASGMVEFRLPGSDYSIETTWMGILVDTRTHNLEAGTDNLVIRARIYYLDMLVVDSDDIPVNGAEISVTIGETGDNKATVSTGAEGRTGEIRLPGTDLDITVTWLGVMVSDINHVLDGNGTLTIDATIYYLDITASDSRGAPVGDATVEVTHLAVGSILASEYTDSAGTTVIRMPGGGLSIGIKWLGSVVYEGDYQLGADASLPLSVNVFYLDLMFADSRAIPVENAVVDPLISHTAVSLGSFLTNDTGKCLFRVPEGGVDMTVRWNGADVLTITELPVSGDIIRTLNVTVHYLDMTFRDSDGALVEGMDVSAEFAGTNTLVSAGIAGSGGTVTFRMPAADYDIRGVWMDKDVYVNEAMALSGDAELAATADIHYLAVTVTGRDGKGLDNAYIEVLEGGKLVASGYTTEGGSARFRLPGGAYTVKTRYRGEYMMSDVDTGAETSHTLTADSAGVNFSLADYPLPIYTTNAFFAGLALALLIALMGYLFYRDRKAQGIPDAGTGETDDAGQADDADATVDSDENADLEEGGNETDSPLEEDVPGADDAANDPEPEPAQAEEEVI